MSYVIWDVKKLIFSEIKVDPLNINKSLQHLNGIQLRILSIVYSAVLNDFYGVIIFVQYDRQWILRVDWMKYYNLKGISIGILFLILHF